MVVQIHNTSLDSGSRQMACILAKNTIVNKTNVSLIYPQEENIDGLWNGMADSEKLELKNGILAILNDNDASVRRGTA